MCNYSDAMLQRGIEIGQLQQLIKSVLKGKYTIEEAAEEAGIEVSDFKEKMKSLTSSQPS